MAIDKDAFPKEKDSITLFGEKKKSKAQKIVDDLANEGIPAKIIQLDNGTEKVINLVDGKAVYSGKIEAKDNSVGNQINELLSGRKYPVRISDDGNITFYDPNQQSNEFMDTSDAVRETFDERGVTYTGPGGSYTFSETPTTDVYSEGYFPEEDNLPSSSVVTTKQLFGEDTNYVPNTNYPRKDAVVENQLDEDRNFLQRTGDKLMKVFTQLKDPIQVSIDPVSGENVARSVPMVGAIMDSATIMSSMSGLGATMGTVSDKLLAKQESDARFAAEGFTGYAAIQAIDLGTGNPVTITASPGLGGTVATSQNIVGPLAYNGSVFQDATAVAAEAIKFETPTITGFADRLYRVTPPAEKGEKEIGRPKVQVNPLKERGDYNDETGEVNLGAGRFGNVTGIYLTDDGTYQFTTGRSSLVTDSKGNPVTTATGIVYSGLRGDIVSSDRLPDNVNLLERIESGADKTDDFTLSAITGTQDFTDQDTKFDYDYPTMEDYSTSSPIDLVETEFSDRFAVFDTDIRPTFENLSSVPESGVTYSGPGGAATFSETFDTDVYSEGDFDLDFTNTSMPVANEAGDVTYGVTDNIYSSFQDSNQYQDSNDNNNDSGGTGGAGSSDMGFATAEGGRIGKQEGGTTVKPVSQIVQGAGFIAPQQNATDQQTIADDIPMEAEEGDFIINAPAAEFAGRQDIVDMILEAINSLKEKGVDIQYGNPKIPVKNSVQLAVSRNEVYVPKVIAEEIGYDKLEKINNRGKREVERRQQESQKQANRGGFVRKAEGDVVDRSNIMGEDEGNFLQNLGRFVVDELGDKIKGFISPKEEEKQELQQLEKPPVPKLKPESIQQEQKPFVDPMKKVGVEFPENSLKGRTYSLLTLLETLPNQDTRIGYVPKGSNHNSGVTVGLGFDIGQHSAQDLLKFKFSKSLYEKLIPYAEKKLEDARVFIKDNPLNLTDEELSEINVKGILDVGMTEFEENFPEYKDTPAEDKAVLFSAYHIGGLRPDGFRDGKRIKRTPDNPKAVRYGTFDKVYRESGSIQNALTMGILDKIKNKNDVEWNRADKAKSWVEKIKRKVMPFPTRRPSSIKPTSTGTSNPTSSFINSPTMG